MRYKEVGVADSYFEYGGSGCPDLGTDLLGVSTIFHALQVGYMGPDAAHEEGAGRIPP